MNIIFDHTILLSTVKIYILRRTLSRDQHLVVICVHNFRKDIKLLNLMLQKKYKSREKKFLRE